MTEITRRRGGVYHRDAPDKPARLVPGSRTQAPSDPAHRPQREAKPGPAKPAAAKKED